MGPYCVISLGIVSIVMVRFGITSKLASAIHKISSTTKKLLHTQTPSVPQPRNSNDTRSAIDIEGSASKYREPLLYYIQDSVHDYSATDSL